MANRFYSTTTPQILLDTANVDGAYDATHDQYVTPAGTAYSTQIFFVSHIEVRDGVNGDDVIVKSLPSGDLSKAVTIIDWDLETGNLNHPVDFIPPIQVNGLLPHTLDNSSKVAITYV